MKRLKELGINLTQIISITTDNGKNVLKMVRDLEEHLQKSVDDSKNNQNPLTMTPSKSKQQSNSDANADEIDHEIECVLGEPDISDDTALELLFSEYIDPTEEPTEMELTANQTLLNVMSSNLSSIHDLNVMWDITGVNCSAHTLQLVTNDAIGAMEDKHRNVIELCRRVAKFLRKESTIITLKNTENAYEKKPRLDVSTRWCSTYFMMDDVHACKKAIEFLAEKYARNKKLKMFKLLLKKWNTLRELIVVLQVPYKATVALQNHRITLSDAFGIWLKIDIHLSLLCNKKSYKTNLARFMLESYRNRKDVIFNNPAMICALYMDPRFRGEIIRNQEKNEQAKRLLSNLWRRIRAVEAQGMTESSEDQTIVVDESTENCSGESSDLNMSIDFDNPALLNNYLARNQTQQLGMTQSDSAPILQHRGDIDDMEMQIELFDPPHLDSEAKILHYWANEKEKNENMHQLAMVVFAIPPTEVQIERDFSRLEHIFSNRRYNLSPNLVDDILLIHLNKQLFDM
ncbi:zinc finger BED domain-containing protein 4-like, partial [Sitodiplosis mosellana]|uniref:zinc finger BED domain-containing protein 4-like n=1 Tax=Sitodiplosis mosellana TaxID=263140 RepID=UPI002443CBFE